MKLTSLEAIFRALDDAHVAYLVVGGVAVNAYGHSRATADLDLVVGLSRENTLAAVRALAKLGYQPQVPVELEAFADPDQRRQWVRQKNMKVFSLRSEAYRDATVDLFVTEPFDFDAEVQNAESLQFTPTLTIPVLRLPALISMKYATGRGQDRDDAERLGEILRQRTRGPRE